MAFVYTKDFVSGKYPGRSDLRIGDYTYGSISISGIGEAELSIGKFTSIASGCRIFLGREHRIDWISTYPFSALYKYWPVAKDIPGHPGTKGNVSIGCDVWLASNVTVLSGVTIGDGAVVSLNAVVAADVPPYWVVGGLPARPIRPRFSEEQIEALLQISWWEWDPSEIALAVPDLLSSAIDLFIAKARDGAYRMRPEG